MPRNNPPPTEVAAVQPTGDRLTFDLEDGRAVSVPLASAFHLTAHEPAQATDH